jgi:hypothetical protein
LDILHLPFLFAMSLACDVLPFCTPIIPRIVNFGHPTWLVFPVQPLPPRPSPAIGASIIFVFLLVGEIAQGRLKRRQRFPLRRLGTERLTGSHDILVLPGKSTGVNVLDTDWNQVRAGIMG